MKVTAYKTHKIQPKENLFEILDKYLPELHENAVVAIASKIVSICEGRVVKKESEEQKDQLIHKEAEYYQPEKHFGVTLTINHNMLVAFAGIDESNSNGNLILWPQDPQKSANEIREYLAKKHTVNNLGIILTDSKVSPLRWGVTGYALAHSGFLALKNYIGESDIYGKKMKVEQTNIADSLTASACVVMGEGNEQQPLAVITDVDFIKFQLRNPTEEELDALKIKIEDDLYAPLLQNGKWKKGKGKTKVS